MFYYSNIFKFTLDLLIPKFNLEFESVNSYLPNNRKYSFKKLEVPSEYSPYLFEVICASPFSDPIIADLIQRAKFNGELAILDDLTTILLKAYLESNLDFKSITFVPSDKQRFSKRGYHIPEILAKKLSSKLGLECQNVLYKIKPTKTQVSLNKEQRMTNLNAVFELKKDQLLSLKEILLIDDVTTTMSTIAECAKSIQKSYSKIKVSSLVVAG